MICLAYLSTASVDFDLAALTDLVTRSQAANAARDVTGVLCFHEGGFLQVLEGAPSAVDETYRAISRDRRHHGLLTLYRAPIRTRLFGAWRMALVGFEALAAPQQSLCLDLRRLAIAPVDDAADHRGDVEGLLNAFRAWLR